MLIHLWNWQRKVKWIHGCYMVRQHVISAPLVKSVFIDYFTAFYCQLILLKNPSDSTQCAGFVYRKTMYNSKICREKLGGHSVVRTVDPVLAKKTWSGYLFRSKRDLLHFISYTFKVISKAFFFFNFWCQTFHWYRRFRIWTWIMALKLTEDVWHQKYENKKEGV